MIKNTETPRGKHKDESKNDWSWYKWKECSIQLVKVNLSLTKRLVHSVMNKKMILMAGGQSKFHNTFETPDSPMYRPLSCNSSTQ